MPRLDYDWLSMKHAYLFEDCFVPLADQGLVLVRGFNTIDGGFLGVGKSSLFNGFSRVQVGKSGKDDRADEIINDHVGQDLEKVLRLRKDGHPYEIRQYRKHSLYGTAVQVIDFDTGKDILPSAARKRPQKWIREKLLEVDDTTFFNILYLRQDFNHAMMFGKQGERRQKYTTMFDLHFYDQVLDQVKSHIRMLEATLEETRVTQGQLEEVEQELGQVGGISKLRNRYKKAARRVEAYQAGWYVSTQELEDKQELLSQLALRYNYSKELKETWESSPSLREQFDSVSAITETAIEELEEARQKLSVRRTKLEDSIDGARRRKIIESQLGSIAEDLEAYSDIEGAENEVADIKSRLHYLTTVELPASERLESLQQQLNRLPPLPKNTKRVRSTYEDLQAQNLELEGRVKALKRQLSSGICPECERPLSLSEEEYATLSRRSKDARKKLKKVRSELYELKTVIQHITQHDSLSDKINNLATTRTSKAVQDEIDRLRKRERKLSKVIELSNQRETLEQQLQILPTDDPKALTKKVKRLRIKERDQKTITKHARTCLNLSEQLADLPEGNRKALRKEVKQLKADIRELASKIKRWSGKIGKLEGSLERIEELQAKAKKLRKRLSKSKKAKRDLDCYETLKRVFGSKGLKQERFESILQEATTTTVPAYTNILWPNKQVSLHLDLGGDLEFYLRRKGKKKQTRSNLLSGGESHKAGLAFLLGLRDLKEIYTNTSFNLLIIDEPFGNLDPQGEEALLSILELLKSRFSSIFVISHRPEVIGSSVWDQTWWVVREKAFSKLYTDGPPEKYERLAQDFMTAEGAL